MDGSPKNGSLKIFTGPMFSGKTENLIALANRELIAQRKVQYFVPRVDTRHGVGNVVTNAGKPITMLGILPEVIDDPWEIPRKIKGDTAISLVDEGQFFDPALVAVVKRLLWEGRRLAIAGLNLTADGNPFDPMPALMALSTEEIGMCFAVCTAPFPGGAVCGKKATRTHRKVNAALGKIVIGGADLYSARCLECFNAS